MLRRIVAVAMHSLLRAHSTLIVAPVLAVNYSTQVNLEVELDLAKCHRLNVAELKLILWGMVLL